jgi:hypothetical protein
MKLQRFTRTEAIAVMSLAMIALALLLALTGPKRFRYTQYHGSGGVCTSSLKQLGSAAMMYADGNAHNYPGPVPSTVYPVWDIVLGMHNGIPYSPTTWSGGTPLDKELALFVCHDDQTAWVPTRKRFGAGLDDGHFAWGYTQHYDLKIPIHRSYSLNLGDHEIAATADKIATSSIASPADTIQLCELHDARNLLGKPDLAALSSQEFVSTIFDGKKAPCHGTLKAPQVLALFYDGHVELLDETEARKQNLFRYKK